MCCVSCDSESLVTGNGTKSGEPDPDTTVGTSRSILVGEVKEKAEEEELDEADMFEKSV